VRARVFRREGDNAPLLDASQERCGRKEGTRGTHAILGLSSFCPAEFQTLNTYLLPGGGLGRLGGRHNTVKPQINNHLSVVLSIVPDNDACEAKACVGTSMRAFDRVELVFRFDPLERFADGYKRITKINQQLAFRFGGIGAAFVAHRGRLLAIELSDEREVRACHVLDLLREGAHFGRAESRLFALEFSFRRAIGMQVLRHGFGGGADFVLLQTCGAKQCGGDRFCSFRLRWAAGPGRAKQRATLK